MTVDFGSILLAFTGIGVAAAFAVFAGTISARIFFDASRDPEGEEPRPPLQTDEVG